MIHTVTLNPTLDLTYLVDRFREDDTTRAHTVHRAPGGKGINVSRVATRIGHPTVALGFMGGHTGLEVVELLEAEGVRSWFTPIDGPTRTNPIVQDETGHQVRVSAPGPSAEAKDVAALWDNIFALKPPHFLLASGSRLKGVPEDFYAHVIRHAREQGIRTVVDADGDELRRGIEAGAHLIKPNKHELVRYAGVPLETQSDVIRACHHAISRGASAVAVSLGAEGALFVRPDGVWKAKPPQVQVQSAVGSGDSLVAGLCAKLAEGVPPGDALRFGVACGTATAMTTGTALCTLQGVMALLPAVEVGTVV